MSKVRSIDTILRNTPSSATSQRNTTDTLPISVITQSQRSVTDNKEKVDKDNKNVQFLPRKTIEVQDTSDSDSDSDVPIYNPDEKKTGRLNSCLLLELNNV